MGYCREKSLKYWDDDKVESMYGKHLLKAEINAIKKYLSPNTKILDAGCGEGEGTAVYSSIPGTVIHAVDFSDTRLKKAAKTLRNRKNVFLKKCDLLEKHSLDNDYDVAISQRFLINITEWRRQKKVLLGLMNLLRRRGILILLEGSKQGADSLNAFRAIFGLDPIVVKWHNLFLNDSLLLPFMKKNGFDLIKEDGLGAYFLLTRGIRPVLDKDLNWDCKFNQISSSDKTRDALGIDNLIFSRLKLWVFQKEGIS